MAQHDEVGIISALLEYHGGKEKSLSERQYTVAVGAVTLNLVIVAGLITLSAAIATTGKILGSIAIVAFDLLAVWYICQKSRAYWDASAKRSEIEALLWRLLPENLAGVSAPNAISRQSVQNVSGYAVLAQGWKGSLAFVIAVVLTTLVATAALWLQDRLRSSAAPTQPAGQVALSEGGAVIPNRASSEWRGFYYSDLQAQRGKPISKEQLAKAPSFTTVQECVEWSRARVNSEPAAGFECAMNCRFLDVGSDVICQDSTTIMK